MNKKNDKLKVAIIAFPGAQRSAIHGMDDFLKFASQLSAQASGPELVAKHLSFDRDDSDSLASAEGLSAIILPPCLDESVPTISGRQQQWIISAHGNGAVACSVCAGAFVLASTGLLDGRPATTHWRLAGRFCNDYPGVLLAPDRILIDGGDIITAGGVMAWVDLVLRLIERFQGPSVMMNVARNFVVDPGPREQRYYSSFSPVMGHGDTAILKVQTWLHTNFQNRILLEKLAEVAGLSERTFARRFLEATGLTPISYLQAVRIESARALLELSNKTLSEVTWDIGYTDIAAFRKIFMRLIGLSPNDYRKRFGVASRIAANPLAM